LRIHARDVTQQHAVLSATFIEQHRDRRCFDALPRPRDELRERHPTDQRTDLCGVGLRKVRWAIHGVLARSLGDFRATAD
jgi:hypothetical protein